MYSYSRLTCPVLFKVEFATFIHEEILHLSRTQRDLSKSLFQNVWREHPLMVDGAPYFASINLSRERTRSPESARDFPREKELTRERMTINDLMISASQWK